MKYKLIRKYFNDDKEPLIVYRGSEPKKVIFQMYDENNYKIGEIDLWNRESISLLEHEILEISTLVNLRVESKKSFEGKNIKVLTGKIYKRDSINTAISFYNCDKNPRYILLGVVSEVHPSYFGIFVYALVKKV